MTHRAARIGLLVLAGLTSSSPVRAENWLIVPSVALLETLTDNVNLAPADGKQSDLITDVTPGIRIDGVGARAKLRFDYQMHNLLYARDSARNNTQNYLNALGTLEAVENWLFVEARGSITQQAISPFGAQPINNASVNSNRAETSTYQVSPYITGKLGPAADYLLRYNWTTTNSKANLVADTGISEWVGSIKGSTTLASLGWAVDGSSQKNHYDQGRTTEATRLRGSLVYQFDPQIRASISGGREANNYASPDRQASTTYGAGLEWAPTERTQVSALKERRFFGDGHSFVFRHRTPLTAWSYSDRKDIDSLPNQLATAGAGTAFDLLFNALATRIPDPVARAQEVERLLQQNGIPADLAVARGFLTTRVFLERHREASVAVLGVTNTVTFTANQSDRQAIGIGAGTADDFTLTPDVRQRGIGADWAHRLSPLSSLNLLASWLHSTGSSASSLDSTQRVLRLLWSFQLGPKTFASIGARQVRFDSSSASDFSERAVMGSFSVNF